MRRLMAHLGMSSMMVSNLTNRHNNIEMFDKCEDAWKEEKGRAFVCDVQISKHKFHHLNNLRDNLEDVTTVICMEAPVDMVCPCRICAPHMSARGALRLSQPPPPPHPPSEWPEC